MKQSQYMRRSVPLADRVRLRSDARPVVVECPVCGRKEALLASVARSRKTCGNRQCTTELKRINARKQAGSIQERLMRKMIKTPAGCWEWTGTRNQGGYGVIVISGLSLLAHRVSYSIHVSHITREDVVCHHCDNPRCINPDHLYAGTHQTNANDRKERGRGTKPQGSGNGQSKLSDQAVIEIRAEASNGVRHKVLAERYGVSPSLISKVVHRHAWVHLA